MGNKHKKEKRPNPNMEAAEMNPILNNEMTGAYPFWIPMLDEDAYADLLDPAAHDDEDELRQ